MLCTGFHSISVGSGEECKLIKCRFKLLHLWRVSTNPDIDFKTNIINNWTPSHCYAWSKPCYLFPSNMWWSFFYSISWGERWLLFWFILLEFFCYTGRLLKKKTFKDNDGDPEMPYNDYVCHELAFISYQLVLEININWSNDVFNHYICECCPLTQSIFLCLKAKIINSLTSSHYCVWSKPVHWFQTS